MGKKVGVCLRRWMIWAHYSAGDMQSHGTTKGPSRAYEILSDLLCRRGVRAVASAVQELRTNIRQLHI